MPAAAIPEIYDRHYAGDRARRGLFDALAAWVGAPERVSYAGSFIHVTASFVFPSVTYLDNNRNARRFFSRMEEVRDFVRNHKVYANEPSIRFYGSSYEDLPVCRVHLQAVQALPCGGRGARRQRLPRGRRASPFGP